MEGDRAMGQGAESLKNRSHWHPSRLAQLSQCMSSLWRHLSSSNCPEAYLGLPSTLGSPNPTGQEAVNCPLEGEEELDKQRWPWKLDLKVKFRECAGNSKCGVEVQDLSVLGRVWWEMRPAGRLGRWQARSLGLTLQVMGTPLSRILSRKDKIILYFLQWT